MLREVTNVTSPAHSNVQTQKHHTNVKSMPSYFDDKHRSESIDGSPTGVSASPSPRASSNNVVNNPAVTLTTTGITGTGVSYRRTSPPGEVLSRIVDDRCSGTITWEDFLRFLDAMLLLPSFEHQALQRQTVIAMVKQVMSYAITKLRSTTRHEQQEHQWQHRPSLSEEEAQCSTAMNHQEFEVFLQQFLPATSVSVMRRLEQIERYEEHQEQLSSLIEREQELQRARDSHISALQTLEVLLNQCQQNLFDMRSVHNPLAAVLHDKEAQLDGASLVLSEKTRQAEAAERERDAVGALLSFRTTELREWEARLSEWTAERAQVRNDIEATDVEEHVLIKRLEEVQIKKKALVDQEMHIAARIEDVTRAFEVANESRQDAMHMQGEAQAALDNALRAVEHARIEVVAIEGALQSAARESTKDHHESAQNMRRQASLMQDRSRLEEVLRQCDHELSMVRSTKSHLTAVGNGGDVNPSRRDDEVVSLLIDELRISNEHRRADERLAMRGPVR